MILYLQMRSDACTISVSQIRDNEKEQSKSQATDHEWIWSLLAQRLLPVLLSAFTDCISLLTVSLEWMNEWLRKQTVLTFTS